MYDKLPTVRYITPQGFKPMTDITVRIKIDQIVAEEGAFPIKVTVPETDRPDIFSHKLYNDSSLHWVLLNLNDIVNPFYGWVLSSSSFDNYVAEKYPGFTLFLTNIQGNDSFAGSFRTNDIVFSTGSTLVAEQPNIVSSLKNARVVSYDPQYSRLVIEFTQRTEWLPVVGEYIAGTNTDQLGVTRYQIARIGKIVESQYAMHHFENGTGDILNPRLPIGAQVKFPTSSDGGFTFGATLLGKYINENQTTYSITNRVQEIRENDDKRNIDVVHKNYLSNLSRDIEAYLNNG